MSKDKPPLPMTTREFIKAMLIAKGKPMYYVKVRGIIYKVRELG